MFCENGSGFLGIPSHRPSHDSVLCSFDRMGQLQSIVHRRSSRREGGIQLESFPDLSHFPPEVAVSVLSHLNATDLCLAACVWKQLADNELLWLRYVEELPFLSSKSICCFFLIHVERRDVRARFRHFN